MWHLPFNGLLPVEPETQKLFTLYSYKNGCALIRIYNISQNNVN